MNQKQTPELPAEIQQESRELLKFINSTPIMLSLLYDLNMMPEQLTERTKPWFDMLNIANHFRTFQNSVNESQPNIPRT